MDLAVFLDQRFFRTPDGTVWTMDSCAHSFFHRYLTVFDGVVPVARIEEVNRPGPSWKPASGPGVSFQAVPHYFGSWDYLTQSRQVKKAAGSALQNGHAIILRVPSQVANSVETKLRRSGRPYAVEVVGDPHDLYAPGSVRHPLRLFFRRWFRHRLRAQCAAASAAAYVTAQVLQQRYPSTSATLTTNYSSVELPAEAFAAQPRAFAPQDVTRLIAVGSLQFPYKGADLLIEALQRCLRNGLRAQLEIVGEGRLRSVLQQSAASKGLAGHIRLTGPATPGEGVRARLDEADLFVHPSRAEGLPRAMIEAMARGLPCIGSRAGGIPELLSPEDTVPVGDPQALADKIAEAIRDPERMTRMSARNWAKARDYQEEVLQQRRNQLYAYLKDITENWSAGRSPKLPELNGSTR